MDIRKQPWYDRAHKNILDFFAGTRKVIFEFNTAPPENFCGLQGLQTKKTGLCDRIVDHEMHLQTQVKQLNARFESGFEDDYIYRLKPYTGVGLIASAFGCQTEFPDNGDPITHPIMQDIHDVDSLRVDIKNADIINLTIDKIRYFLDHTQCELPIAAPDLQSPIDLATVICNYTEILCSTLTAPDKLHQFLKMITEVSIEVIERLREIHPAMSLSSEWWLPDGIWLSDDLMAVLSYEQYEEFAFPYNDQIGRYANGMLIHSCGKPLHCLPSVRRYHKLMGMQFWEETIEDFHNVGGDFPCVCPVVEDAWHNLDRRQERKQHEEAFQDAMTDLETLPNHTETPIIFQAVCPEPSRAEEYHSRLMRLTSQINS